MKLKFTSLILVACILTFTACSSKPTQPISPSVDIPILDNTAINLQIGSEPIGLDPAFAVLPNELSIVKHIFAPLVGLDENGKPINILASEYSSESNSDGNMVYTFTIADEAVWTNGEKITPEDFVASYQRILDPMLESPNAYQLFSIKNAHELYKGEAKVEELGVTAKDNKLIIELNGNTDDFLERLSLPAYLPVNTKSIGDNKLWSQAVNEFVASGKFKPVKWEKGSTLVLERNDSYINQKEIVAQKLNFVFNLTDEQSIDAVRTNKVLFSDMLPSEIDRAYMDKTAEDKGRRYHESPIMATVLLEYNNSKDSPLSDATVREALSIALDREALSEAMGSTFSTAASLLPDIAKVDGEKFFTPLYETTKAQTVRAKTLLENKKNLEFVFLTDNSPQNINLANDIVKVWSGLGVKCTVLSKPFDEYQKLLAEGKYDVTLSTVFGETMSPLDILTKWLYGSTINYAKFKNEVYEGLVLSCMGINNITSIPEGEKTATETDSKKTKLELMQNAEKILLTEEWAVLPIAHYMYTYVASDSLSGYTVNHLGEVDFSKAIYVPENS